MKKIDLLLRNEPPPTDVDPRYEISICDMRYCPQSTGDLNEGYESPSQPPPGEELGYIYVTPQDNRNITHTYLISGDTSKVFDDQELEYSYATPEVDSTYQDLDSVE